jgi:diguanylate cyclase (GGDEF)-like protein/PAS domain S-box-containing protein
MAEKDESDFQLLTENSADIVCRGGPDRVLKYVSPSCFRLLGWTPEEMTGKLVDNFILPEDLPVLKAAMLRHMVPGVLIETATIRMLKKDGSSVWMEDHALLVRDPETGEPIEFIVTMRDISERKMLEEKLQRLALTDDMTGLWNRRAFDEALRREWKRTLREGSQVSLLLLDVDHFKEFNDQYGHQVGDDCLRAVAAAVRDAMRATDTAARYGGEEFAAILPNTNSIGAVEVAEKLRITIEALQIPHNGNPEGGGWVTVSVGAATALARDGGTMRMPESLLQAADNALYKAKHKGRNSTATALLLAPREMSPNGSP